MELVRPDIGLLFWMLVAFSILLIILKKFAWKPILKALHDRENSIKDALESADKVKSEMAKLQADNEEILAKARIERDNIIREAKSMGEKIVSDAKNNAASEANKIVIQAKESIESQKKAAIEEMKSAISELSIKVAENILREKLKDPKEQSALIEKLLKENKLN